MMASTIFSKFLPTTNERSFYDQLRNGDDAIDVENRAVLDLDERNLTLDFHDDELDPESLAIDNSQVAEGEDVRVQTTAPDMLGRAGPMPTWSRRRDDPDNDVPASLLVEPRHTEATAAHAQDTTRKSKTKRIAAPSAADRPPQAQWEATRRRQQPLHHEDSSGPPAAAHGRPQPILANAAVGGTAYQKAMWRWVNVTNLDAFTKDVYDYYQGYGLWCILQERALHLVDVVFVATFLTFLGQCVDYSKIPHSKSMDQIVIPQCTKKMSGLWNLGLWIFVFYFVWKAFQFFIDLRRLFGMRDFYTHLLNIPEKDMQSISWQDVILRVMALRDQNPRTAQELTDRQKQWIGGQSKDRMDAHDIANRIMRRENYLIALFNKDVLDLSVPLPFLRNQQMLSKTLEWTLMFSVIDFVFDERGQVNQEFLKADRRALLSRKLKGRFLFAGTMNLVMAPFLTGYLVIVYFLTYYNEFQKNPSALGARSYTPLALWKFREFNELPHLFRERINMSYPFATRYLDQFPKHMTERLAKTVAFIAGSVVAVLAIASLVDPELFLSFEITPDRTVLFYLGIFGSLWAFARGMVKEEDNVFDPEYTLRNVIDYTHYQPAHWKDRLHTYDTKLEFAELYKNRIVIFAEEILSILITPLILFFSLPNSSEQIIDFFREFTIHVDGLGYICSFAMFNFQKGVGVQKAAGDVEDPLQEYYESKDGKMAASYYNFVDNYVTNPKTGIYGHQPPGLRHQFQPPPNFPGLNSPSLAAHVQASRAGPWRVRGTGTIPQPGRLSRLGLTAQSANSLVASMLLDPRHQPTTASLDAARNIRRSRGAARGTARGAAGVLRGEHSILEEPTDPLPEDSMALNEAEPEYESGHGLGESAWQTSPGKMISRESTGLSHDDDTGVGVLGLMYQFQKEMQQRPGVR